MFFCVKYGCNIVPFKAFKSLFIETTIEKGGKVRLRPNLTIKEMNKNPYMSSEMLEMVRLNQTVTVNSVFKPNFQEHYYCNITEDKKFPKHPFSADWFEIVEKENENNIIIHENRGAFECKNCINQCVSDGLWLFEKKGEYNYCPKGGRALKNIEHEFTNEIVCPHCGYEFGDSYEVKSELEDIGKLQCCSCDKYFYAVRNVEITYCTEKCRVGTCRRCGKENVVIENLRSYGGGTIRVDDYCHKCLEETKTNRLKGINTIDLIKKEAANNE